jgi:hypothetical protein
VGREARHVGAGLSNDDLGERLGHDADALIEGGDGGVEPLRQQPLGIVSGAVLTARDGWLFTRSFGLWSGCSPRAAAMPFQRRKHIRAGLIGSVISLA